MSSRPPRELFSVFQNIAFLTGPVLDNNISSIRISARPSQYSSVYTYAQKYLHMHITFMHITFSSPRFCFPSLFGGDGGGAVMATDKSELMTAFTHCGGIVIIFTAMTAKKTAQFFADD
jgi:hypothetical protein